jgi:hypothetical protein
LVLKQVDDAQTLAIMVETPVILHAFGKNGFSRMPEGCVAKIVGEYDSFGEVFTESKGTSNGSRDLRAFDRMGQSVSIMIILDMNEDLRLEFEPAKGPRMYDSISIALERAAVGVGRLGNESTRGIPGTSRPGSQTLPFFLFEILSCSPMPGHRPDPYSSRPASRSSSRMADRDFASISSSAG